MIQFQEEEKTNLPRLLIIIIIWVVLLIGGVILRPYLGILGEQEGIFGRKSASYQRDYNKASGQNSQNNNINVPNNNKKSENATTSGSGSTNPASCSNVSDGVCPAQCSFSSDADCCLADGRYWLETPWGYFSCYTYYDSRCRPKQYCSTVSDNCCPSWCLSGNDIDCCLKDGRHWVQGRGCY